MEKEIWKAIDGYENYQISSYGNVKSKHKILKATNTNQGYLRVSLRKNGITKYKNIHRLVAEAFIPNPNNYPCVNHKDGNKKNNKIENLEFCTHSHNNKEAFRIGLRTAKTGKENPRSRKIMQLDLEGNLIKIWDYMTQITEELGYDYTSISHCCRGETKTSYGYKWKYVEMR